MKRILTISAICFLGAAISSEASSVLYFTDYSLGQDRMAQALGSLDSSYSVTTVTTDAAFTSAIASGSYDLGILMIQNYSAGSYSSAITALANFTQNGGKAIYSDWSRDSSYASLFGVGFTGGTNNTSFTVTDASLQSGLVNPIDLVNPGWGVFSTDLSGGISAATFTSGASAIAWGTGKNSIVNGFLNDTFVNGNEGVQLYQNEIRSLTTASGPISSVPDAGSSLVLLSSALTVVGMVRRKLK